MTSTDALTGATAAAVPTSLTAEADHLLEEAAPVLGETAKILQPAEYTTLSSFTTTNPVHATGAAAGMGGALVTVLLWAAGLIPINMPANVAVSITVLVVGVGGWIIHRNSKKAAQ